MKFDGYGATVRTTTPRQVIELLSDALNVTHGPGPSMKRYGITTGYQVGQRLAAWVGVDRATGDLYIEAKGETTPAVVAAIRAELPGHSAPRIDVCEDYAGEGAFSSLQALIRAKKGQRTKGGYVALPDDDEDGRTWAAGTRGGVAYIRVYEPGKMKERRGQFAPDSVRVELEARPHYARDKKAAATMSPVDVWGLSAWSYSVGQALMQTDVARYQALQREYAFDKTTSYIATAFRRHLTEMIANGEDLQRTFQAVWADEDLRHGRARGEMQ